LIDRNFSSVFVPQNKDRSKYANNNENGSEYRDDTHFNLSFHDHVGGPPTRPRSDFLASTL
jgi:hypothetical protein